MIEVADMVDGSFLTGLAASHVQALARAPVDDAAAKKARLCVLDLVGCAIRARTMPWAGALTRYAELETAPGNSVNLATGGRTSASDAAFANGILGHSLIREDMHVGSGSHIGVLVIPAMLALAERDGLSGHALLAGIVAGYEVAAALGQAIWGSGRHNRHLRPSGMTGAFGVAAGAAAASGLDPRRTAHALSIAGNFACGVNQWAWSGGQEIFLHAGMAAQSGLRAHDLARAGIEGCPDILEGADGLFAAFGCGERAGSLFAEAFDLSKPRAILGVRHKPVSGCNFVQTPVAAMVQTTARDALHSDQVERIVLDTFTEARVYPGCDHAGPFTSVQQSKMSLQFAICAALVHEQLDETAYADFDHPEMQRLLPQVEIGIDPEFEAAFPGRQGARVTLHLTDGTTRATTIDDVPWLDDEAVLARFRREIGESGDAAMADRFVDALADIGGPGDCRALFAALADLGGTPPVIRD
ncbi:hypothetical protein EBMC1_15514 [Sphingopyxis sp. MC1]|nr:hypothetical protein EBMC1_15514 [Sphingopyxis sp. MC1]